MPEEGMTKEPAHYPKDTSKAKNSKGPRTIGLDTGIDRKSVLTAVMPPTFTLPPPPASLADADSLPVFWKN